MTRQHDPRRPAGTADRHVLTIASDRPESLEWTPSMALDLAGSNRLVLFFDAV